MLLCCVIISKGKKKYHCIRWNKQGVSKWHMTENGLHLCDSEKQQRALELSQ